MISIKVPPLGESITEATIARWLKKEGDAVAAGDTLVELETDKVTVEVPALKAGVLTRQSKKEGDTVSVDETLGELDETATAAASPAAKQETAAAAGSQGAAESGAPQAPPAPAPAAAQTGGAQRVSPAAQRTASASGVDTSTIRGTGRGGVVSKPDVIEQGGQRSQPTAKAPAADRARPAAPGTRHQTPAGNGARETREPMSTRRKRIAEHLLEAKQATASLTTFNEIDMSAVMALRARLKEKTEQQHGVKLTFMPFFVKAACMALREVPVVNAQVDGDAILYKHYVHMGIAVASEQGLVVPNIKDADQKGLIQLSHDIADIATRARNGKLTMDNLTGGTFTITNGGVFGSLLSTPILNHPQVGILGLHKFEDRPVAVNGKVEIRPMMYVALSYDHRIVDGQQSVQFLVKVKEYIEDPASMLLD